MSLEGDEDEDMQRKERKNQLLYAAYSPAWSYLLHTDMIMPEAECRGVGVGAKVKIACA